MGEDVRILFDFEFFVKLTFIALTLRDFSDWTKILHTHESNTHGDKEAKISLIENWWNSEILDKKCNFTLCISKIDEQAMCEFEFACFLYILFWSFNI